MRELLRIAGVRGNVLAAGEVLGRSAATLFPSVRARIGKWARRAPKTQEPISIDQLCGALKGLGLRADTATMVHASWAAMKITAKPTAMITALRDLVGSNGTLLMPSHPIPIEKDGLPFFDVERTPSAVGLLSEALRRTPGAIRSPVPEAPVCALGRDASQFKIDFRPESAGTPYGRGSPWWRLAEMEGQVVFLGVPFMRANTLEHAAFDLLDGRNPVSDFYTTRRWRVRHGGSESIWEVRRQRPELERFLASGTFDRLVRNSNLLKWTSVHGTSVGILDAQPFLHWHLEVAEKTGLPYWGFRRNPNASQR